MRAIPLGLVEAAMMLGSRVAVLLVEQAVSVSKAYPPYPSPRLSNLVTWTLS